MFVWDWKDGTKPKKCYSGRSTTVKIKMNIFSQQLHLSQVLFHFFPLGCAVMWVYEKANKVQSIMSGKTVENCEVR